jgi:hypothetical protein
MDMSFVIAAPEMMTAAATDLANIGSTLIEEHTAAAASTVAVTPAAADEVSAGIAHLFSAYAQDYQELATKAAAFQDQFVQNLKTGAASYTSIEAYIASLLQSLNATADGLQQYIGALVSLFDQNPIQFLLGTLLFFVLLPADVVFLLLLPILAIFAAA